MSCISSPRAREHSRSAPSRNSERRTPLEHMPSRIILDQERSPRKSPNSRQESRSKYCSAELNSLETNRRLGRNDSAPARRQGTRESAPTPEEISRMKDVMFLRKMLAMNKKQEMMLNKRLARLLEEEEFQNFTECRENKRVVEPPQANPPVEEVKAENAEELGGSSKTNVPDSNSDHKSSSNEIAVVEEKPNPPVKTQDAPTTKTATVRKVEYDINGRRVYYYSDIEKESTEEETDQKQEKRNYECQCVMATSSSKTVKRGSACSKKTFTMKKSLTYIHNHGKSSKKPVSKGKKKVRHEDGDSTSRTDFDKPLDFEMRRTKVGCQGDGGKVQNLVVHCSTVYRNTSTAKNNVKVWNYESLPSLKSDKSFDKNKTATSDRALQECGSFNRNSRHRPISVKNNNIEIKFKNPQSRKDEGSSTVETVFFVHEKFSDV